MKKIFSLVTLLLFAFVLVGCGETTTEAATTAAPTTAAPTTTAAELTYEIALVTDVGNIDDKSFNEGAWNGVLQYATDNDITYTYYRPTEDSDAARVESIDAAIAAGAKVVVCPGYLFETAIYEVQGDNPDVAFLLLDGEPHTADYATYETLDNTHNVLYQEEQAGFLAGYAAVMDGYRELGFMGGMAVPAVIRFGYGYVQGADYAADELDLTAGDVNIKYGYADAFWASPELETKMDLWYSGGTEVVFAAGGGLYLSVVAAAENTTNGKVIGVDVDQVAESARIITSAMKGLTTSVYDALGEFYDNSMAWPTELAGVTSVLGATTGGIGLPIATASWGFDTFTIAQYDAIFALLVDGTVVVSPAIDAAPTVTLVTVDYEE
ncbi:MAG: BMP family ABC transporter substrate-binding protein [Tenericutes bacterium]|nr:BMP family ABC transporter substrate-binding protein [Mycoplasmatota bacterium]